MDYCINLTHLNPMFARLQQQIQEYNNDTEVAIEKIANRKNSIKLPFVVFNILVFSCLRTNFGRLMGCKQNLCLTITTKLIK